MKKYLKYIFIVIILIISFLLFFFYSNKREEKTIDIEPSPSTEEPISESITITLK